MKVEIWSDVACPFCWIGKHHFESAVEQLKLSNLDIVWKSFELDPYAKQDYDEDMYTLLANKYGQTREWAKNSAAYMKERGKEIGLEFNFDDTISTNTFNAHRLIQLAKSKVLQNEAEEALFKAYFRDGRHIGDSNTLLEIGPEIGIEKGEIEEMLNSDLFTNDVRADEQQSQQFGIRGVPYFIINRKYGISGAQPIEHFVDVLKKAQSDEAPVIVNNEKDDHSCSIDGCD